jgi:hypothetical protein
MSNGSSSDSSTIYQGQRGLNINSTLYNSIAFVVEQALARTSTVKLVKVMAVNGGGGAVAKIGTVDVMPITSQVDGTGKATPHGVIHGVTWHRHQGGMNGTIMDPVVGDIGILHCNDRDVSLHKANYADDQPIPGAPGSHRRFDMADGVYHGAALQQVPNQYVQYTTNSKGNPIQNLVAQAEHNVNAVKGIVTRIANQDPDNKADTGHVTDTASGGNITHNAKMMDGSGGTTNHNSDVAHIIETITHTANVTTHNINASNHNVNAITNIGKLLKTTSIAKLTNYIH